MVAINLPSNKRQRQTLGRFLDAQDADNSVYNAAIRSTRMPREPVTWSRSLSLTRSNHPSWPPQTPSQSGTTSMAPPLLPSHSWIQQPGPKSTRPSAAATQYQPALSECQRESMRSSYESSAKNNQPIRSPMFLTRKLNGSSLFMKFGVDHHGFVVPFLRPPKHRNLQLNSGLRPTSIRPKLASRPR
jgi:hypothetical protein